MESNSSEVALQPKKEDSADKNLQILTKANELSHSVANITSQLNATANRALDVYENSQRVKRDVEALHAWSNVELAKIAAKYKSCELFLNKTFSERSQALEAFYKILDNAIENNDRESLIAAMRGMSDIVTSSPLQDFEKFAELYNDTSKPLLDF